MSNSNHDRMVSTTRTILESLDFEITCKQKHATSTTLIAHNTENKVAIVINSPRLGVHEELFYFGFYHDQARNGDRYDLVEFLRDQAAPRSNVVPMRRHYEHVTGNHWIDDPRDI